MKLPRGFGKNYFSLSAITVTVNAIVLHKRATAVDAFHRNWGMHTKEDAELEALEDQEATLCQALFVSTKACHCSGLFLATAKKILARLAKAKKIPDFYKTLNSDISPPSMLLVHHP